MGGPLLAIFLGFLAFCFLAGWVQAFRERLYLFFLALCLMALAVVAVLPRGHTRMSALVASGLLFILALIFAARETIRNMRAVRERRQALEQEMWAYLEELKKKHGQPGGEPRE